MADKNVNLKVEEEREMEAKQVCVKKVEKVEKVEKDAMSMSEFLPNLPVLPPEITCRIFRMCDSETFHKIMNVGPEYHQLLKIHRVEGLFPLVLPFLLRFLTSKQIIRLRRVCSSFRDSVDFVLQYGTLPPETDEVRGCKELVPLEKVPCRLHVYSMTTLRFTKCKDIELFLEQFSGDKNPFPGRSIELNPFAEIFDEENLQKFEDLVKKLLARFGKHIFRLSYTLPVFTGEAYALNNIKDVLHQVKNIRHLLLTEGDQWLWLQGDDEDVVHTHRYLPELPKLKILYLPLITNVLHKDVFRRVRTAYHYQVRNIRVHADGVHFFNDFYE